MGEPSRSAGSSRSPKAMSVHTEHLRAWLPLYLKKTDATISRINKLLSAPAGTDTVLCSLSYTLVAFLKTLESFPALLQRLPGANDSSPSKATSVASALSSKTQSLRALASLISDIRVFFRLWGLLAIYSWGRSVFVTDTPRDQTLRLIAYSQIVVNVGYQALENVAYLAQHGIWRGWSDKSQTRMWVWSSRFWAAHTALDLGRLWRSRGLRIEREKERVISKGKEGEKVLEEQERAGREHEEEVRAWWSEVLVNLAYAPLTVHWSLEQGLVGEVGEGLFGSIAGFVGLRQAWRQTA